jgi:hypothetical protein
MFTGTTNEIFTVKTNHGEFKVIAVTVKAAKIKVLDEWAEIHRDLKILEVTQA